MEKVTDYLILGSGRSGIAAADILSKTGASVTMVSKQFNGAMATTGIVFARLLHRISSNISNFRYIADSYLSSPPTGLDFKKINKLVDSYVDKVSKLTINAVKSLNVDRIEGSASFLDGNTVLVSPNNEKDEPKKIKFSKCLIATGASAYRFPSSIAKKYTNPISFIAEGKIPESVIVVGAGFLGYEVASFFYKIGSRVTIIEKANRVLPSQDAVISKRVEDIFKKLNINIILNTDITKIERVGQKVIAMANDIQFDAEDLSICTGRKPVLSDMQLDNAGIHLNEHGYIFYDKTLKTSNENIYIAGDISGIHMNDIWANYSAYIAAENMMGNITEYQEENLPVFTSGLIDIAYIGLTEQEARDAKINVGVFKHIIINPPLLTNNPNNVVYTDQTIIKITYDKIKKVCVGIIAMGLGASDLIVFFTPIIKMQMSCEQLAAFNHINPILNEFISNYIKEMNS